MTEIDVGLVTQIGTCSKDECLVNSGGTCAEGHEDPIDCPHYELTSVDEPASAMPEIRRVTLPDGEALRADELERVLRSHPASIVVPLGRVGAGKTTLIALIYHLLRTRRLSGWAFTDSETIIGFARRAHHASFTSGRLTPITPRTAREESGLHLHLGMRRASSDERRPVLLVDLSGEQVVALTNGQAFPVVQKAIGRADHIPVVIDGRAIASDETRSLAVVEARGLLKMLEKQARPEHARVCLVITKGDLLAGQELSEIIDAIVRGTLAEGSQHFVTADRASDRTNDVGEPLVSLGYGVGALLTHVAELPATEAVVSVELTRPNPSPVLRRIWEGR